MAAMNTVSDIFDVFGGNAAVARILGVNPSTASEMKRRESIPVEYWRPLIDAAPEHGCDSLTVERLAEIMAAASARRKAGRGHPQETAA